MYGQHTTKSVKRIPAGDVLAQAGCDSLSRLRPPDHACGSGSTSGPWGILSEAAAAEHFQRMEGKRFGFASEGAEGTH